MITTTVEIEKAVPRRVYRIAESRARQTEVRASEGESWLARSDHVPRTQTLPDVDARELATTNASRALPRQPALKQASVQGVILAVDQDSVRCELALTERTIEVSIPRGLFEEPVAFGQAFIFEMHVDHGVHQPRIRVRENPVDRFPELVAKAQALTEKL